ncbi:hypothetical protein JCM19274_5465 [Algibacter lectus]|uniref:Uncharacterized protein n=1 Tax=Algibacter lectus TaxID=221126 RepID=A0A090X4G7_9FLAO|nr:hypothetical protein [Algibacter lectus]GAL77752.1 hypothetical protein JCM19274_5465 [Algibacter lectus]
MDILLDLALSDEYKNDSGKYFDNDKGGDPKGYFSPAHPGAYDEAKINALLVLTNNIIE